MTNGIVLSSRIRFARNLKDYKFVSKLNEADANKMIDYMQSVLLSTGLKTVKVRDLDESTIQYLLSKRLISKLLIDNQTLSALAVNDSEDIAIMLNEQDHIRVNSEVYGLDLFESYKRAKTVMDIIENTVSLAYDDEYGYLCSCPTNVGSAMSASVRMCLPALVKTNKINKIISDLSQIGITVRGDYESSDQGDIFHISNYASLGVDDMEIINKVQSAVLRLQELEMSARRALYNDRPTVIEDLVGRSYGLLMHCHTMKYSELMEWISNIKMGASLGLINVDIVKLDTILASAPYSVLAYKLKKPLSIEEYNIQLAKYVQDYIEEKTK